eukprot:1377554-Pleurochrysis_carterae.AAC.2
MPATVLKVAPSTPKLPGVWQELIEGSPCKECSPRSSAPAEVLSLVCLSCLLLLLNGVRASLQQVDVNSLARTLKSTPYPVSIRQRLFCGLWTMLSCPRCRCSALLPRCAASRAACALERFRSRRRWYEQDRRRTPRFQPTSKGYDAPRHQLARGSCCPMSITRCSGLMKKIFILYKI